jgi:hypothetical protein
MAKPSGTDNSNLAAKLALRRHFLRAYHADGKARVFDCCQAKGVLWSKLRREFKLASYWGVDLKAKKGRLKIDSARVLNQPGWADDVIDVDVYGAPWVHWDAILRFGRGPLTVFLTIGQHRAAMGVRSPLSSLALAALGLGPLAKVMPKSLHARLDGLSVDYCLGLAAERGFAIVEVREAVSAVPGNARYIGVRLSRRES